MQIIWDNIIFSLQHSGGISVVWQQILKRGLAENEWQKQVLDYPSSNVQRQELNIPSSVQKSLSPRKLERYRCPDWNPTPGTIFHSSYFRYLPGAINVTTVHDLTYHYFRYGLPKAVHLWEERRALKHSSAVICVSQSTRADLLKCYPCLDANKVHVVYNGVSEVFAAVGDTMDAVPFSKGEYLLYVGNRNVQYKNYPVAVEVARLSHLPLVLVGAGLTVQERTFLDNQLGKDHYFSLPFLSETDLAKVYRGAFCLLYPSAYEGFGIPVIEAQRCACPVMVQNTPALVEVLGEGGIVVPNRENRKLAEDMAEQLHLLHAGQINREQLIRKGLLNAQQFSWERCYQETKQIYLSLYKSTK